ncbi:protein-L-isoaspartate(D-aspartate) O-methyltransferase [Aquabacterium sp. A08]|uniref:protein-L-isoaspartate(D-aspartate) O-methyltransferase n=1 Tax=Aquabacterium sp. A08 TaxID=2718532 RepID=UPI00352FF0BA
MKPPAPPAGRPRPAFPASLNQVVGQAASLAPARGATRPAPAATLQVPSGAGMDSSAVRQAMVRKLAAQGLQHPAVLQAFAAVERHRFVDSALVAQAYEDTSLPIGLGQTISKPSVVGRMLELLCECPLVATGRVLEIGTGCGYQAALLAQVCREVYSMERLRGLHDKAREHLRPLRLPNVHLIFGDGMLGFPGGGPYAGIVAAAGGHALPQPWLDQLAVGGRLVAPAELVPGRQSLVVVDRTPQGYLKNVLEGVWFVPLKSGIA